MPTVIRYVNCLSFRCHDADRVKDPLASYGAENVAKIRAAAAKYDPRQIFQTRVPGGFKISSVHDNASKTEL